MIIVKIDIFVSKTLELIGPGMDIHKSEKYFVYFPRGILVT